MFDTMLHLRSVGQCKKTDLYGAIGRRTGMAPKLDRLEDAGLLVQERCRGMTVLSLTEEGRQVADLIGRIRQTIDGGPGRHHGGSHDSRPREDRSGATGPEAS